MSVKGHGVMETNMHGHPSSILHTCPSYRHLFKTSLLMDWVYRSDVSCPLLWMSLMMDWTTSEVVP